jgi:hypothetical protein
MGSTTAGQQDRKTISLKLNAPYKTYHQHR